MNANGDLQKYLQTVQRTVITSAKQAQYSSKIQENSGNTGILFKTVEKLLNSNPAQRYPSGTDNLSESFVDFFTNKIVRFRNDLDRFLELQMTAM